MVFGSQFLTYKDMDLWSYEPYRVQKRAKQMYVKDVMLTPATQIQSQATVGEALEFFQKWHVQNILIIGPDSEFMGEIRVTQFAKMLLPEGNDLTVLDVGGHESEARDETYADLQNRLRCHLKRKVTDFMDDDVPVVTPETPLMDALILLRDGELRIAVINNQKKLVGSLSLLTILRRIEEFATEQS
jgi:CBS domain-containing protein